MCKAAPGADARMMRNRMSRLAVCEVSTYRWSFEEDVLHYRRRGFEAMGVWRYKLAEFGEEKAVDFLQEQGMRVSSLHWAGGFTGSDGRTYNESLHDAFEAIEQAAALNAGCLVILTGSRGGHTKKHSRRILRDALTQLSEAASACKVQLAIEPMHVGCAFDFTFLTELPDTLDLIVELNKPNLGIVLDCYHMAHDPNILHWIPSLIQSIRLVQMGDAKGVPLGEQNRCLLGQGNLPLSDIVRVLEQCGYTGDYEIELQGEEVEHLDYEEALDHSAKAIHGWMAV